MIDLKKIKKIHFTGIKGVGMTALAVVAKDFGIKVRGSDVEQNFVTDRVLKIKKIRCQNGFRKENFGQPDLLVFTAAHKGEKNIEVLEAKKINIPVLSQAQALALFMQEKKGIAVCGVGGKTTTASLLATIFKYAGLHPSFAIGVGGIKPLKFPGCYDRNGSYFITEADEYFSPPPDSQPKFFFLKPTIIAISNLEYDHPDVYHNLNETLHVFKTFIEKVPKDGLVTACIDCPAIKKLIRLSKRKIVTYGFSSKADWQITSIKQSQNKTIFSVKHKAFLIKNIRLLIPGEFNVKNATASLVVADFCKIPFAKIKNGLAKFKGVQRRFEFIKKINGVQLYDDYAHHPAQIKATLKAVRKKFPNKRLIIIFQPHTYSRTKALLTDFAKSFSDADLVIITDIYASAREKYDPSISGKTLTKKISDAHSNASYKKGEKEVVEFLSQIAKPGDIIFTLGAGDVFLWHDKIIKNLKRKLQNYSGEFKVIRNIRLAPYTSFGIGGPADYFCEVKNQQELVEAIKWAGGKKIPYFILGLGTNVLIADRGFKGLVIKNQNAKIRMQNNNSKFKIIVESGVSLAKLVSFSIKHKLSGLENLAGVPGTIGGAVVGNAGTKQGNIGQLIDKVTVLSKDGGFLDLNQEECQFKYRQSRFQKTKEIILKAELLLKKTQAGKIKKKIDQVLLTRKDQPQGMSTGSIFKNPDHGKSAGWLIEKCGLKGKKIGKAMISLKHANWIINTGNAKAADVLRLIRLAKERVKHRFGIKLNEEIFLMGDF